MTREQAWKTAIKIVGGPCAMARELGFSKQRVSQWTRCRPKYADEVNRAVRRAIRRTNALLRSAPTRADLAPIPYSPKKKAP